MVQIKPVSVICLVWMFSPNASMKRHFPADVIVNVLKDIVRVLTMRDAVGKRGFSVDFKCYVIIIAMIEPDESSLLSPLESFASVYPRCGFCRDDNAACMKADNQTTCWCRAGYGKAGDRCGNLSTGNSLFSLIVEFSFYLFQRIIEDLFHCSFSQI